MSIFLQGQDIQVYHLDTPLNREPYLEVNGFLGYRLNPVGCFAIVLTFFEV